MLLILLLMTACDTPVIKLNEPPVTIQSESGGSGKQAKSGDFVVIDYRILLPDGTAVLQDDEYRFQLGQGAVIAGVDDAVLGMRTGSRRVAHCPPHRHWGRQGYGDKIPPNTTLTLDIRLKSIH